MATKLLGDGAQAKVYKAHVQPDNQEMTLNEPINEVAVKVFNPNALLNRNGQPKKEYDILQQLKGHSNIVEVFNYYSDNGRITLPEGTGQCVKEDSNCMNLEFCKNGDLIGLLLDNGPFQDEKLIKHLMLQICNGLEAVHSTAKYAHLDIKPDNILIGNDYQMKLTDFGFA